MPPPPNNFGKCSLKLFVFLAISVQEHFSLKTSVFINKSLKNYRAQRKIHPHGHAAESQKMRHTVDSTNTSIN